MRTSLSELLATGRVLLADGATGTNYMMNGLGPGEPPEFWVTDRPDDVMSLHQQFVDAGADIILTDTFGCNPHRLMLHNAQARTYELAKGAAELARRVADAAPRPVVVAGSVGPTGALFEPMGVLNHADAVASFADEIRGLRDGGADVAWIETMSSPEEVHAAVTAAIEGGMPYVVTCSYDTAGRTMMGLMPGAMADVFADEPVAPLAMGANCGVGASDILVTLLEMEGSPYPLVSKGNCGVPHFVGTEIVYTGTPDLMAKYAALAIDAGVRIVGGCCGTSPEHLASMRAAIDAYAPGDRPTRETIVEQVGPLTNTAPAETTSRSTRRSRG
ncbi:MAG TPA: betaine--homocysteine S-methyltransferase [Ilumatobacteraceae bacterium]|nr:betaine--homocysteine S-methyltransferase [Ilumatobacteraceae bacterium]HRB04293.1 betaine--homocysteine S-methyltransferase [Ilumatobacteraceae bacterium]